MGTGVGEAALIGAAVGGGTALLTGNDPLRGALLGGVTGGAGGAMFGGAAGAGAGAAGAGAGATTAGAGAGVAGGVGGGATALNTAASAVNPLTSVASGGTNALSNTLQAAQITPTAVNQGIAGAIPNSGLTAGMGPGGIPEFGMNLNKAVNDAGLLGNFGGYDNLAFNRALAPQFTQGAAQTATQAIPQAGISAGQTMYPALSDAQAKTFFESDMGLGNAYKAGTPEAVQPGMLQRGMNWYGGLSPMGKIGVGIGGGVALNALSGSMNPPGIETKEEEENPFGLATYDRKKYKSVNPLQHSVYRPSYAAEGGVMQSYAQGGIAALASGGMGNNQMYPQGLQDQTQFATPSQMPTSAQVVNADYEVKSDPYTGTPLKMAEGGEVKHMAIGGFAGKGGATPVGSQVYYDPEAGKYYTLGYDSGPMSGMGGMLSIFGRGAPTKQYIGEGPNSVSNAYENTDATPNVYQSGYQNYIEGTPMVTTPDAFEQSPNFIDAYNLLAATSPNIASTISPEALVAAAGIPATSGTTGTAGGMAQGGIAGYDLGGYAAGGNPRLLKGPGDGMSDNIPATIGGRQPARLADGEFVVPADVVSHLGNGSTDAGAKHLYNMMDKVRKARTGTKKQGKQIKPGKFLPA